MPDITGFRNHLMKIPPLILRRPARAFGAAPAPLFPYTAPQACGFPVPPPSPAPCLAPHSGKPARFPDKGQTGSACFAYVASGATCVGSLRLLRNRCAFPCLSPGRRCRPGSLPASHLLRLALAPRSPAASLGGGLPGHSFCHSRESGNPGDPVCLSLSFPQYGFAFNVYSSREVSFRRSFAGVSKAKRRGISARIG